MVRWGSLEAQAFLVRVLQAAAVAADADGRIFIR